MVAEELTRFAYETFNHPEELELTWYETLGIRATGFSLKDIRWPWRRMFNVAFDVELDI